MKNIPFGIILATSLATISATAPSVWATSLYWDPSLVGGTSTGGAGTWNGTLSNWYNSTSDATWTSGADAYFNGSAGSVALGSAVSVHNIIFNTSGYTVSGNATNNLVFTGTTPTISVSTGTATIYGATLAGSSGLVKDGSGALYLAGNTAAYTLTGGLTVNNGTLTLNSSYAGDSSKGMFSTAGNAITVNNGATLNMVSALTTTTYLIGSSQAVAINNGVLGVNSTYSSVLLHNLTLTNGTVNGNASLKVGLYGDANWNISGTSYVTTTTLATMRGSDSTGTGTHPTWTITTNDGAVLTISSQITAYAGPASPAVNLVKAGNGMLVLANANNNYYGSTSVLGGVLSISSENNLGANPTNGNYTSGAFNAGQLTLNGGALQTTASFAIDDSLRGITIGSNGGTFSTNASTTLTIGTANIIAGAGALTKAGSGALVLLAANTYTGATYVNAGTLTLASTGSLASSAIYVASAGSAAGVASFSGSQATFAKTLAAGTGYSVATLIGSDLGTKATVAATSTAAETVAMSWRTRSAGELSQLISDVVYVAATSEGYTLSLTYDATTYTDASTISIAYYDGSAWELLTSSASSGVVTATVNSSIATAGAMFAVVPEPGTLVLMAAAGLGLIVCVWQKRKK